MAAVKRPDFIQVKPSPAEVAEYQAKKRSSLPPAVPRAKCVFCEQRIWYSGLAIGSHTRVCHSSLTWSALHPVGFSLVNGKYRKDT